MDGLLSFLGILANNLTLWLAVLGPLIIGKSLAQVRRKLSDKILDDDEDSEYRDHQFSEVRQHLKEGSWAMAIADITMQTFTFLVPLIYLPIYFFNNYSSRLENISEVSFCNDALWIICLSFCVTDLLLLLFVVIPGDFLEPEDVIEFRVSYEYNVIPPYVTTTYIRLFVIIFALLITWMDVAYTMNNV